MSYKQTLLMRKGNWHRIASDDAESLVKSEQKYGHSWRMRGGVGAFMMLARKWDRIEKICMEHNYNIFDVIFKEEANDLGIMDDIRDLRRYLMLVEEHTMHVLNERLAEKQAPRPSTSFDVLHSMESSEEEQVTSFDELAQLLGVSTAAMSDEERQKHYDRIQELGGDVPMCYKKPQSKD